MTPAAVDVVIARVLEREGGIADVGDGKGVTRFGQTQDWLDDNGFVPPTSAADAAVNYARWLTRTRLEAVCQLSVWTGDAVVDFAIHSGLTPAVKALQLALGATVDGALGPRTLAALAARATDLRVAHRVLTTRLRYVGVLLGSADPDRRKYARNWTDRIAAQLDALPIVTTV